MNIKDNQQKMPDANFLYRINNKKQCNKITLYFPIMRFEQFCGIVRIFINCK